MATAIPDFPSFDVDTDPTGLAQRWKKWLARYENLIIALDITEPRCEKALLLHYAGQGVHDMFDTLPDNPPAATTPTDDPDNAATPAVDDYQKAVAKLDAYFNPRRNVDYETYVLRQARQKQGETLGHVPVSAKTTTLDLRIHGHRPGNQSPSRGSMPVN